MDQCKLTLHPYGKPSLTIKLSSSEEHKLSIEQIVESSESVFSDLSYKAQIDGVDTTSVQQVLFYVNGNFEQCQFSNGQIRFPANDKRGDRRIFLDCYGFVEITIVLKYVDLDDVRLHSNYLSVLVRKGTLNNSVKAMAEYIYNNQQELLFNGEAKPKNIAALKESGRKSLESQILLAEVIAVIYENSYGYFKANCRFRAKQRDIVDNFEKLQYMTPKTLQFIAQHPEQLKQVIGANGIRRGYRIYQPVKTLTIQNVYSADIYENRVIVSFLKTMVYSMNLLLKKIEFLLSKFPIEETENGGYIYSSYFIFASTQKILFDNYNNIKSLLSRFELLWGMYNKVIDVSEIDLSVAPKPSAIFHSVPQYNKIFLHIHQWFTYGIYDFSEERFMLSFIKISSLYESYVLTKIINYFKSNGLVLREQKNCAYPVLKRWKYQNINCYNTFIFGNDEQEITLYYQPVIFDTDKSFVNKIGLYRNNTISLSTDEEDERRGHYYVPDFLIKVSHGDVAKYIICDAKFSSLSTVQNYYVSNLTYKYLFSISPINENDSVAGLCIFYGQCVSECNLQSVYDRKLKGHKITPFAELHPLVEGINTDIHFERIMSSLGARI